MNDLKTISSCQSLKALAVKRTKVRFLPKCSALSQKFALVRVDPASDYVWWKFILLSGHSGEGFFTLETDRWYLRGVLSSGWSLVNEICDSNGVFAFTNIDDYSDWIVGVTSLTRSVTSNPPALVAAQEVKPTEPTTTTPQSVRIVIKEAGWLPNFKKLQVFNNNSSREQQPRMLEADSIHRSTRFRCDLLVEHIFEHFLLLRNPRWHIDWKTFHSQCGQRQDALEVLSRLQRILLGRLAGLDCLLDICSDCLLINFVSIC